MELRQWREELQSALLLQRLPRAEVERLVEELSDHGADLIMEAQSMDALQQDLDARLGTPDDVAQTAKQQFQQRTFAGRHPAITFLLGPFLCMIGSILAVLLSLVPFALIAEWMSGGAIEATDAPNTPPAAWEVMFVQSVNAIFTYVPLAVSTWLLIRLGLRSGRTGWSAVSWVILIVWALFFSSVVGQSSDGHGTWTIGFSSRIGLAQLLQAAVPLTLGAWVLRRSSIPTRMVM